MLSVLPFYHIYGATKTFLLPRFVDLTRLSFFRDHAPHQLPFTVCHPDCCYAEVRTERILPRYRKVQDYYDQRGTAHPIELRP